MGQSVLCILLDNIKEYSPAWFSIIGCGGLGLSSLTQLSQSHSTQPVSLDSAVSLDPAVSRGPSPAAQQFSAVRQSPTVGARARLVGRSAVLEGSSVADSEMTS